MRFWDLLPDGGRAFLGTLEALPAGLSGNRARVEIFGTGRPAETVAVPVSPWVPAEALSVLNLAFAGLADPKGSFTVGLAAENQEPNEPPIRFSGPVQVTYLGDEERGGVPVRKYRIEGEGVENRGGFAWVHRDEKRIEALELDLGPDPNQDLGGEEDARGSKLQLVSVGPLDAAGWEEAKRTELGPPPPRGPVEAVAVKPHPVPGAGPGPGGAVRHLSGLGEPRDQAGPQDWPQHRHPPGPGPDKQPDPIFEFGGGPGEAIAQAACPLPSRQRLARSATSC